MKDLSKLLLAGLFTIGFSACNDDGLSSENGPNNEPDAVYMQFKLETPETRSGTTTGDNDNYVTSDGGKEEGKTEESEVKEVLVLLTAPNDAGKIIATSEVIFPGDIQNGLGSYKVDKDTYVVAFQAKNLTAYADQPINVFVYCNPDDNFKSTLDEKGKESIYSISGDEENERPWKSGEFFMSNANNVDGIVDLKLPAKEQFVKYNSRENPIDLGLIEVERSVARFDYKDGSSKSNFTYPVMDVKNEVDNTETKINVVLKQVALINLSKNFYYLRHMAPAANDKETADKDKIDILIPEKKTNFVIDTDWDKKLGFKNSEYTKNNDYKDYFFYHVSTPNEWNWESLSEIVKGESDENDTWNPNESPYGDYKIWRYVTENTIPSVKDQVNALTTGVVFRGQLVWDKESTTTNTELKTALEEAKDPIYVFQNVLYGTREMIKKQVYDEATQTWKESALSRAYQGAFMKLREDDKTLEEKEETEWIPGQLGFTTYSPRTITIDGTSTKGYFAEYYYWNRHNDNWESNEKPNRGEMGVMEFAVVRNNVYKLSVTKIDKFGHPTPPGEGEEEDPDPDPDPVDPDDPDEDENIYFQVAVKVLPWTVRINNIEF